MAYAVTVVAGFAFGALDQYLGSRITFGPWAATVSLLSAPWLLLPFLAGCTQTRARRAATLGLLAVLAALAGYFAMTYSPMEGVPLDRFWSGEISIVTSGYNLAYILAGLVLGPLYGWLGQRWRVDRFWLSAVLVAAPLILEPLARRSFESLTGPPLVWWLEVALGLLVAAGALALVRAHRPAG
jgi:hypothetical protein